MILAHQLNWKLMLFEGIAFCFLGIIALTHPFMTTWSVDIVIGAILIIAGVVQGIRALKEINEPASVSFLIAACLSLVIGILFLVYPSTGMLTLTLLLTVYFLMDGIIKIVNSWQLRAIKGWFWLLISGLISLLLAIIIVTGLPMTAYWVLGVFLGIYLLVLGITLIILSFFVKKEIS